MTTLTRGSRIPQIGFFGLNGAKVILGLTILLVVDGWVFNLYLSEYLLDLTMSGTTGMTETSKTSNSDVMYSTAFLTLIFGFVIAGANLLGIMIGEFVDSFVVNYWNRIFYNRITEFQSNILSYTRDEKNADAKEKGKSKEKIDIEAAYDEAIGVYILHHHLNGKIWDDTLFLSYKQYFSTRIILILSLFLISFFLIFNQWKDNSLTTLEYSNTITTYFDNLVIILMSITIILFLLLLSLRVKIESSIRWVFGKLLYKDLLPLIMWGYIFIFLPNISLWGIVCVTFFIIVYIILINSGLIEIRKDQESDANGITKHLKRLEYSFKWKWISNNKINKKRLFGKQTKNQWFNVIVCYYDLFFYLVETKEKLSKIELYLSTIAGVYVLQSVSGFVGIQSENNKKSRRSANTLSQIEPTELPDSNFLKQFEKTVNLIHEKLETDNFEPAVQLYRTLNEQILAYFVLGSYYEEDKKPKNLMLYYEGDTKQQRSEDELRLIEEAVPLYILDSPYVTEFIGRMKSPQALMKIIEKLPRKVDPKILVSIAQNQKSTEEALTKMLDKYSKMITEDVLLKIAQNPACTNKIVCRILENKHSDKIGISILLEITRNKGISEKSLIDVLKNYSSKINDSILLEIIQNPQSTEQVLKMILDCYFDIIVKTKVWTIQNLNSAKIIMMVLEDEYFDKISTSTLLKIVKSTNISGRSLIKVLKNDSRKLDNDVVLEITQNPQSTKPVLTRILNSYFHILKAKIWTVQNPNSAKISTLVLEDEYSDKINTPILLEIAKNPKNSRNTLEKMLKKYSSKIDAEVLEEIAKNPKSSRKILEILLKRYSSKIDAEVLEEITKNPKSSRKILEMILDRYSGKINTKVLEEITKNLNNTRKTLEIILDRYSGKINAKVLEEIAKNPKNTGKTLEIILDRYSGKINAKVLEEIAKNPKNTGKTLEMMLDRYSGKINAKVLEEITKNPKNTEKTLKMILDRYSDKINTEVLANITQHEKSNNSVLGELQKNLLENRYRNINEQLIGQMLNT